MVSIRHCIHHHIGFFFSFFYMVLKQSIKYPDRPPRPVVITAYEVSFRTPEDHLDDDDSDL